MSASTVHHEHIHVLLWVAAQPVPQCGPLAWYYDNPIRWNRLDGPGAESSRAAVGQMLLDENAASVNYRYDIDDAAAVYVYRQPRHTDWSLPELLNALRGYEYQSCEHPGWDASQAKAFCDALQQRLVCMLPGYNDGPWLITPGSVPATASRRLRLIRS